MLTKPPTIPAVLDEVLSTDGSYDRAIAPGARLIIPVENGVIRYLRMVIQPTTPHGVTLGSAREFAYDLLATLLSETTNNDACDVVIRERSAHLDAHPDLDGFHGEVFGTVVIDAVILDELS